MNNNTTLFGGKKVLAQLIDGTAAEITVRQLPLGEYEKAFALFEDEIALVALICGQPKVWAEMLQPESYEALQAAAQEVNARGFFAWSARRQKRAEEIQQAQLLAFSQLPPDVMRAAMETGLKSPSPSGPPGPRSR